MNDEKKLSCNNCIHYAVCKMYGNYILHYDTTRKVCGYFEEEQPKVAVTDTNVGRKWIPCSDRMPEEDMDVIISTNSGLVCKGMYTERYGYAMRKGFMTEYGFRIDKSVLAWQPLPEPYRKPDDD